MKPIKCEACKLFYDGDKYDSCPHCEEKKLTNEQPQPAKPVGPTETRGSGSGESSVGVTAQNLSDSKLSSVHSKKTGLKGFFHSKKEMANDVVVSTEDIPPAQPKVHSQSGGLGSSLRRGSTVGEMPVQEEYVQPSNNSQASYNPQPSQKRHSSYRPQPSYDPQPSYTQQEEEEISETVQQEPVSIKDAVKNADSTFSSADEKTIAKYNFSNSVEPVVGWIICVEGECKGESFNIKSGRNNIGRSLTNDIALAKEKSVSRERHAAITFEPNKKKFYIQSGESSGLTYVNDELIMMFTELKDYDEITLGESKYIFLRLCGDRFTWDNYT